MPNVTTACVVAMALMIGMSVIHLPGIADGSAGNLFLNVESSTYKTGDTVRMEAVLGDTIRTNADHVVLEIYNPMNEITIKETIETSNGEFGYSYVIGGPLDDKSGEYRIVATYGPETAEAAFTFTFIPGFSDGWLPIEVEAGGRIYTLQYQLDGLQLGGVSVNYSNTSMLITIEPATAGHDATLVLRYPHEFFPYTVSEVFNDEQCARFEAGGTDERVLEVSTYAANGEPTKIQVFGDGGRTTCDNTFSSDTGSLWLVASEPSLKTNSSPVAEVRAGDDLVVASTYRNTENTNRSAVFITEVRNGNGVTILLESLSGIIESNSSTEVGVLWMPDEPGTYELRTFAISDIENPIVQSGVVSTSVSIAPAQIVYPLQVGGDEFEIPIMFPSGWGRIDDVKLQTYWPMIHVSATVSHGSDIVLTLPLELLKHWETGSGLEYCVGFPLAVMVDGQDAVAAISDITDAGQVVSVPVTGGPHIIEISGTSLLLSPPRCD